MTAPERLRPTTAAGVSNALSNFSPELARALQRRKIQCWQEGSSVYAQCVGGDRQTDLLRRALQDRGYLVSEDRGVFQVLGKTAKPPPPANTGGRHLSLVPAAVVLRQRSPYGPCLPLGTVVRQTPKYFVTDGPTVAKSRVGLHTDPCPRCHDHGRSHYPRGYTD